MGIEAPAQQVTNHIGLPHDFEALMEIEDANTSYTSQHVPSTPSDRAYIL